MKCVETYDYDNCIGCGICGAVCPTDCISFEYNDSKVYEPLIDEDKCTNCGLCNIYCIHSNENILSENLLYDKCSEPEKIGLLGSEIWHALVENRDSLLKSASGGIATEIAKEMLKGGIIDKVIHAENILSKYGDEHYKVVISKSIDELESRRGTVYGPLNFYEVLKTFRGKSEKILVIGTGCVISGVKKLFSDKRYCGNTLYTCALICSHNVSGEFTDAFADNYGVDRNDDFRMNFRAKKEEMKDSSHFYTHYEGKKEIYEDRFLSPFTKLWRSYSFAMKCCIECRDFWGREADFAVKDAWGDPGKDEQWGSSVIVIRNELINSIFRKIKGIKRRKLSFFEAINSQKETLSYKQCHLDYESKSNTYIENANKSRNIYRNKGISALLETFDNNKTDIKEKKEIKEKQNTYKGKIVLFGGFAGSNQGDEAQIDETYRVFLSRYPEYEIKILSHVKDYTYRHHMNCSVGNNSRLALWNIDNPEVNSYKCSTDEEKRCFLEIGDKAIEIARKMMQKEQNLSEYDGRIFDFLNEIKTSNLVVFSGGGYLTGKTLSRLWDHLYVMRIANIFNVPYILTGHTIGLWDSDFSKEFAKSELGKAKYISLRDAHESPKALREIGISGDKIIVTHDDALFCRKDNDISRLLNYMGVRSKQYVTVNAHFWGVKTYEDQIFIIKYILNVINTIIDNTIYDVVLLPMTKDDVLPLNYIYDKTDNSRIHIINAMGDEDYDFAKIRAVIADSRLCITMKHHPIIFAMGEKIPTIALCYRDYYVHKNKGALELFGLGKYAVNIENEASYDYFYDLLKEILQSELKIRDCIEERLLEMSKMRNGMFKIVDKILEEY